MYVKFTLPGKDFKRKTIEILEQLKEREEVV